MANQFRRYSVPSLINKCWIICLMVDLDHDMDLLMSDKEELFNADLIEVGKGSMEEAGEEGTEEVEVVYKLTHRRLSEALRIINKAVEIFDEADPNTERNSKVQIDVLASVRLLSQNTERKKDESLPEVTGFLP